MKVLRYIFLSALVPAMLTACGGKKGSTPQEAPVMATMDSTDAHGLRRLQDSKAETTLQFKGKEYHSKVVRTADESLPHVASEMGDTYLDNRITLRLTCGGKTVVDKAFTKQDFAAAVADADFLSKAILEGLVYDKTTPTGIVYAASVCYPGTDMYIPLSITIAENGRMVMEKVDMMEDDDAQ